MSGAEEGPQVRRAWFAAAWIGAAISLVLPMTKSGIWDPYELRVADLSRRIAYGLLGAKALFAEGAINDVPTLGELGRGQLPFQSIAVGFRLFGLHEWAGRLPLALWALAGVGAVYLLARRLADELTAALTVLALVTMPLFFVQARTMLGDSVTFACVAMAVSGFGVALFDQRAGTPRAVGLALGALALFGGFAARGLLIGVALPLAATSLAWLAVRGSRLMSFDRAATAVGVALAVGALLAVGFGARALIVASADVKVYSPLVGATLEPRRVLPTFDFVVHYLGHGLFPWSAVLPVAFARALGAPHGVAGEAAEREAALRVLALVSATVALGVYGAMAPLTGHLPFAGLFAFALLAAAFLRDLQRGAQGSRTLGMSVAALCALFLFDFHNFADKGLAAFAVEGATFPDSFKRPGFRLLAGGAALFVPVFLVTTMENERSGDRFSAFDRDEWRRTARSLREAWQGNLQFGLVVAFVAGLVMAVIMRLPAATLASLGKRVTLFRTLATLPEVSREVLKWFFLVAVAVAVLPFVALAARDGARWLFARRSVRPTVAAASVIVFGATMSLGYYPALAAQLSPKDVFDSYRSLAKSGEPLGMLGVGSGSASYYAGRVVPFSGVQDAFRWLTEAQGERRWLAARSKDLPQLNSSFRALGAPAANLPVLDARSSEILLVSNRLEPNEKNQNPFADWIFAESPNPARKVDGNFGGQLDVVGWDITTPDGRSVSAVRPGQPYQFRIVYHVVASIAGAWETFVHIDGFQRRFNGDHKTLEERYPFNLWRVGDYVQDIYPISLAPNFTPGEYSVYFGLFVGDRRLEVKRGAHNENRLEAGRLRVE